MEGNAVLRLNQGSGSSVLTLGTLSMSEGTTLVIYPHRDANATVKAQGCLSISGAILELHVDPDQVDEDIVLFEQNESCGKIQFNKINVVMNDQECSTAEIVKNDVSFIVKISRPQICAASNAFTFVLLAVSCALWFE